MLVKIIIVLILTIAVGVLGFSDIGEGVFNFVDKSAAAEFAEDARDLTQIIEIYNTDVQGARTAFTEAFNDDLLTESPTTIEDLSLANLSAALVSSDNGGFMKKPVSADYTLVVDAATPGATSAYLRFQTESTDVCNELNEIAGIASPAPVDLATDELAAMVAANVNGLEAICLTDSTDSLLNVAYYRLGSAQ
tara:strand:+ start:1582 stop:2160 length:579 start_codon:yes stop_codon:yes gene_type:complete